MAPQHLIQQFNKDFNDCMKEIQHLCINIENPYDRVRTLQWARKLKQVDQTSLEALTIRSEYAHFLRIILLNEKIYFCTPFKEPPPSTDLAPLPEVLTNEMNERIQRLPKTGPLMPVMCHKAPDGRAFMTVKRCPEGGLFCYLAVSPDPMKDV